MIPKKIHLLWFSKEKKSRFIRRCIKSWEKTMPDYEIRVWDGDSFDFNSVPFVKQAYDAKKWAFVSDYIRLYALYTEGGVYLDSDVKTFKSFDEFLNEDMFIGLELLGPEIIELEAAIMGAEAGHPFLKECMDRYESIDFDFKTVPTCPELMSSVLIPYGMKRINENQLVHAGKNVKILDLNYFGHLWGTKPGNYYAVHYYTASWRETPRGRLYKWCQRNDFMDTYLKLQKITNFLHQK